MVDDSGYFRASAGAVIVREDGRVLALRRKGTPEPAWQMPQGGIGFREKPEDAAWREVGEETGLTRSDLELVAASSDWMVYELPEEHRSAKVGWGQAQRWFLFRAGRGAIIRPDDQEFEEACWTTPAELIDRVVAFRAPVYQRVFSEFARWI